MLGRLLQPRGCLTVRVRGCLRYAQTGRTVFAHPTDAKRTRVRVQLGEPEQTGRSFDLPVCFCFLCWPRKSEPVWDGRTRLFTATEPSAAGGGGSGAEEEFEKERRKWMRPARLLLYETEAESRVIYLRYQLVLENKCRFPALVSLGWFELSAKFKVFFVKTM